MIDLRSDTVTLPTPEMKEAMMRAKVGDDVYGEDETINKLQQKAAQMFGCEAALFCPSGTMTNQIAVNVHTSPGDEVICHAYSHIYNYEGGGVAANSGCQVRLIHTPRGVFTAKDVEACIMPLADAHAAHTALVNIENTCNKAGGTVWDLTEIKNIAKLCREKNLKLHLDGARLFNALEASGDDPKEYGKIFNSISICLSKGLGAPVGSLLLSDAAFIAQAHRVRKRLGGGMRQAGFLAQAAIYALDHHVSRLTTDRERALQIAEALRKNPEIKTVKTPETNIVLFEVEDVPQTLKKLAQAGIQSGPMGTGTVRFVTHLNLTDADIEKVCEVCEAL